MLEFNNYSSIQQYDFSVVKNGLGGQQNQYIDDGVIATPGWVEQFYSGNAQLNSIQKGSICSKLKNLIIELS